MILPRSRNTARLRDLAARVRGGDAVTVESEPPPASFVRRVSLSTWIKVAAVIASAVAASLAELLK